MSNLIEWSPEPGVILALGELPGVEYQPPYEPPAPTLTKRQLRLGLLDLGVTVQQVSDLIDQMDEPDRSRARIEWEDSTSYVRTHPLVVRIGATLDIDTTTLNAAWAAAASL